MGTLIGVVVFLVVVGFVLLLLKWFVFRVSLNTDGDLSYTEEVKLRAFLLKAQYIFIDLTSINAPVDDLSDMNVLSTKTRQDVQRWLEQYDDFRKEIAK